MAPRLGPRLGLGLRGLLRRVGVPVLGRVRDAGSQSDGRTGGEQAHDSLACGLAHALSLLRLSENGLRLCVWRLADANVETLDLWVKLFDVRVVESDELVRVG